MRSDRIDLLALCRVKRLSWYLVAREARRPDGIQRLIHGELTEKTIESVEARVALKATRHILDDLREEVRRELESAAGDGIKLTTVLDDDYPLNLRIIYNLPPPFCFIAGSWTPNKTPARLL